MQEYFFHEPCKMQNAFIFLRILVFLQIQEYLHKYLSLVLRVHAHVSVAAVLVGGAAFPGAGVLLLLLLLKDLVDQAGHLQWEKILSTVLDESAPSFFPPYRC